MRHVRVACLFLLSLLLSATDAWSQDRSLLAGTKEWKIVKSEHAPPGTRMRFNPDGTMAITFTLDGKPREITGTYTLSGNQLTLKLNQDGRERVEVRIIKKLTPNLLVTVDKNEKVEELERN